MPRPELPPCLICAKEIKYLSEYTNEDTNLRHASDITIFSWYGSIFDANQYKAVICDDCLDDAIQNKLVRFDKELPLL